MQLIAMHYIEDMRIIEQDCLLPRNLCKCMFTEVMNNEIYINHA